MMKNGAKFNDIPLEARDDTPPVYNITLSPPKEGVRARYIWMVTAIVFIVVSVALTIYIIYDSVRETSKLDLDNVPYEEETVLYAFPGYFRTPAEQRQLVEELPKIWKPDERDTQVDITENYQMSGCSFSCTPTQQQRKRRDVTNEGNFWKEHLTTFSMTSNTTKERQPHHLVKRQSNNDIFHGCCITDQAFISPSEAMTTKNQSVKVVQFKTKRQYFPSESCTQSTGCTGCTCQQYTTATSAVVRFPDTLVVSVKMIILPGCCKCLNQAP